MSPQLDEWRTDLNRRSKNEAEFEKWLFVHVAGVLFADKAGELLTLSDAQSILSLDQQLQCIEKLSSSWKVSHLQLCRKSSCAKVVIYDRARVQEVLSKAPRWAFAELRYACDVDPIEFLEEVGRRWREKGQIPHEIGLALGYPVKDVLGYMGLLPLPCTGCCGWRIHGDPHPSMCKSREYRQARFRAEAFLNMPSGQQRPGRNTCATPAMVPVA